MSEEKLKIAISQGDINGIGMEIVLKTLLEPELTDICIPVLFSSQKTVGYYRKALGFEDFNFHATRDLRQLNPKKPNVFVCYEEEVPVEMGKSTPTGGKYAHLSLLKACESLKEKLTDVLVTAPINKHNIQSEQFQFPGHSEFLASYFGCEKGAMMLMCSDKLKVGLVTGHIPIGEVKNALSKEKIMDKIVHLNKTLKSDFCIQKPKIAVLGLNPHAGDQGTIGDEDVTLIKPVIDTLKDGMQVYGPYSADGFFGSGTYNKFDAVLAMYHDQGLIPFKTISFQEGVNFTSGLPIIRTSPDHGTAYDLVGKNCADPSSFKKAIFMAIDIYRNRKMFNESAANPLKARAYSRQDANEN